MHGCPDRLSAGRRQLYLHGGPRPCRGCDGLDDYCTAAARPAHRRRRDVVSAGVVPLCDLGLQRRGPAGASWAWPRSTDQGSSRRRSSKPPEVPARTGLIAVAAAQQSRHAGSQQPGVSSAAAGDTQRSEVAGPADKRCDRPVSVDKNAGRVCAPMSQPGHRPQAAGAAANRDRRTPRGTASRGQPRPCG